MFLAGLVTVAALLAALLVQPFRSLRGPGWRALPMLLAPLAMLGEQPVLQALAGPAQQAALPALVLAAVLTLLSVPLALLAAMLLAQPEPPGLRPALAGLGVSPMALYWRVALPALLPGLWVGWLAGAMAGLVPLAWMLP